MKINNINILINTLNKMENKEELTTYYDNSKSFYKKAYFKRYQTSSFKGGENKLFIMLYSYNTPVLCIYKDNKKNKQTYILNKNIHTTLLYSQTTLRHIKEFLKQFYYYNDEIITKNDIIKNENILIKL